MRFTTDLELHCVEALTHTQIVTIEDHVPMVGKVMTRLVEIGRAKNIASIVAAAAAELVHNPTTTMLSRHVDFGALLAE
jgi:seryl-tRNA(Sec) selenium transferase